MVFLNIPSYWKHQKSESSNIALMECSKAFKLYETLANTSFFLMIKIIPLLFGFRQELKAEY